MQQTKRRRRVAGVVACFVVFTVGFAAIVASNPLVDPPWKSLLIGGALSAILLVAGIAIRRCALGPWGKEFASLLLVLVTFSVVGRISNPTAELSPLRFGLALLGGLALAAGGAVLVQRVDADDVATQSR
jgi:hypothetical protein